MAEVNKANLSVLFLNLKKSFQNGLTLGKPQWQRVATRIPSTGAANLYAWLEMFPKMREWIVIGREIFKRETCDKCGSTWDKLDLSGTGQCNYFSVCERENRIKITCHCIFPQR